MKIRAAGPVFASLQIGWFGLSRGTGGAAVTGGIMRTEDGGSTSTCSVARRASSV